MAAPYNPPIKNQEFIFHLGLRDATSPDSFKAAPTIASGDFKVLTWVPGSPTPALVNLATLPFVEPVGSVVVLVQLTAAEMNGDVVTIVGIDQTATKEWADVMVSIPTTSS